MLFDDSRAWWFEDLLQYSAKHHGNPFDSMGKFTGEGCQQSASGSQRHTKDTRTNAKGFLFDKKCFVYVDELNCRLQLMSTLFADILLGT